MKTTSELIYTTKPYIHQSEALSQMWGNTSFALFMEQGTGKSKIIIDEFVNLIERDLVNCVVILAPNIVHQNWAEQIAIHGPKDWLKIVVQVYKSNENKEKREALTRRVIQSGRVLVFLMNIEALSHKSGQEYLSRILRARNKTYLCVDESHKIKTPGAARTKMAIMLGQFARYRRIATGTEAEEGLHNLFAQMKFLDWNIIGTKTYTAFKGMYCVMGGYEMRQIVRYQNQEMLAARIAPYIYQKRKQDCLDLPDKVYVEHHIDLTPEQDKLYTQLETELLVELDNNQLIDTTMMLTRLIRLQEVLCGHLGGQAVPSHRAAYAAGLVEAAHDKSIVFCRFVKDVNLVCDELIKMGINCIPVTGETTQRLEQIEIWRKNRACRALVMTIQVGGTGLTLNEANNTIFYSNSWSATDRLQAEDRNHRIGQHYKVTYHDITVRGKVDNRILQVLKKKSNIADMFRNLVDGDKRQALRAMLSDAIC